MKSIMPAALCFGIVTLICLPSGGQDTNKAADATKDASRVRPYVLKIDCGYGPAILSDQPALFIVQLPIASGKMSELYPEPDLKSMCLQIWLLKTDGTSLPQHGKPSQVGVGNAGWYTECMMYAFEKIPTNELAAVVIRAKGKLYCQTIETNVQQTSN